MPDMALPCADTPTYIIGEAIAQDSPIVRYFGGIFDYVLSGDIPTLEIYLSGLLEFITDYAGFAYHGVDPADFKQQFLNGTVKQSFMKGEWMLGPGLPHPRALTGCAFMTSWEISSLFGLSLCDVGTYRSLRYVCPESCGCLEKNNSGVECPAMCSPPHTPDWLLGQ
jgi:hypothetical protein